MTAPRQISTGVVVVLAVEPPQLVVVGFAGRVVAVGADVPVVGRSVTVVPPALDVEVELVVLVTQDPVPEVVGTRSGPTARAEA